MKKSVRLYHCARCHCQVIICSDCDRGNAYCNQQCSRNARAQSQRRASQKYQSSRKGRFTNAERQRRYRLRQRKKVTHQGSTPDDTNDLLPDKPTTSSNAALMPPSQENTHTHCHFCHYECGCFLRTGFIRHRFRYP